MFVLALWSVFAVHSACESVTTPYGLSLAWSIRGVAVTFTLRMPAGMAQDYDYWGVGLKPANSPGDMVDAEVWIVTKEGDFLAYWSKINDVPNTQRGSALLISFTRSSEGFEAVIARYLLTDNPYDLQLQEGSSYSLIYAYGTMNNGEFVTHTSDDSGSMSIALTSSTPSVPATAEFPNPTAGSNLPVSGFQSSETAHLSTSTSRLVSALTAVLAFLAVA